MVELKKKKRVSLLSFDKTDRVVCLYVHVKLVVNTKKTWFVREPPKSRSDTQAPPQNKKFKDVETHLFKVRCATIAALLRVGMLDSDSQGLGSSEVMQSCGAKPSFWVTRISTHANAFFKRKI